MIGTTNANSGTQVFYLGTGTSFDVSNIPGYQNFTADNFVIVAKSIYSFTSSESHAHSYVSNSVTIKPTCSYNNKTGILSVSNTGASYYAYPSSANGAYTSFNMNDYYVLLITGKIKTI